MEYLNAQLRQLQHKLARKRQLQARCDSLRAQRTALLDRTAALEKTAMKEEADVLRLEGRSLAAFFYHAVGKMGEKLDQERREAYGARVKYDAAVRELQAVEQDLARCTGELNTLSLCEEHYRLCLEEKAAAIKVSGSTDGFEILRLETALQTLECQLRELREAADAGQAALFAAKNVQTALDHAQEMGTWDLFGGNLFCNMPGHDHLDATQSTVEQLQVELSRFRTELIDVKLEWDIQISLEGFSRFSDLFFDGLFADWAVLDRIGQARGQIRQTAAEIERIMEKLDGMIHMTQTEMDQHRAALDTFIVKT